MAKKDVFQVPAEIVKLETMSDRGIRIVLDTQEITDPDELVKLFKFKKGAIGWFVFKETEIKGEDVPDEAVSMGEGETKTPSQRLRGVIFVYWKDVKGGKGDFDAFYRHIINQLIEVYKEKLPPRGEE